MTTETRLSARSLAASIAVVVLLAGGAFALAPSGGTQKGVKPVPKAAKARKDVPNWTKALVTVTQLRIGLHGYETAVRRLREEPWPEGSLARAQLSLLYGHALVTYQRAYSWEVGQREKVESKGVVDLKAWTREQILAEALKPALDVWGMRETLGKEPVSSADLVLDPNDYPKEIRGTLRDAVSY